MGTQLHAIRVALGLEPDERSEENVDAILDFVKDIKFFSKLTIWQQRTLCRTMTLKECKTKEYVFRRGEHGDKFYIILSGSVQVHVPSKTAQCPNGLHVNVENCDCPNRPVESHVHLTRGEAFGELALQSDQPRAASIQATEHTELLVTKRRDYEENAGLHHKEFIEQRVQYLTLCPHIGDALHQKIVSNQDVALMANCLNEVNLSGGSIACRQGDLVDRVIFVRSGALAKLRLVDLDRAAEASRVVRKQASQHGSKAARKASSAREERRQRFVTSLARSILDVNRREVLHRQSSEADEGATHEPFGGPGTTTPSTAGGDKAAKAQPREEGHLGLKRAATGEKSSRSSPSSEVEHRVSSSRSATKAASMWAWIRAGVTFCIAASRFAAAAQWTNRATLSGGSIRTMRRRLFRKGTVPPAGRDGSPAAPSTARSLGQPSSPKGSPGTPAGSSSPRRTRLLRIGTLGPYQRFGDQHINGVFPVSLSSDPVAELYVISKHDFTRRVPKNLQNVLISGADRAPRTTDAQLLEMHRQTERWNAFRTSMHGEALSNLGLRSQVCGQPRGLRNPVATSRTDPVANLEFVGISPPSSRGMALRRPPQACRALFLPKDEELFSQASSRFLRQFQRMRRDPELHQVLAKEGLLRMQRLHDGLPGSVLNDDEEHNPMVFHFEQHWAKLREDPFKDFDHVLAEDTAMTSTALDGEDGANGKRSSGSRSGQASRRASTMMPASQRQRLPPPCTLRGPRQSVAAAMAAVAAGSSRRSIRIGPDSGGGRR